MPISYKSFAVSTIGFLIAGSIALLVIVATSLWLVTSVQRDFGELLKSRAVRSSAADLLLTMQSVETGQRGYLITRDASYLAPYEEALEALRDRQQRLTSAAAELPAYQAMIADLPDAIDIKLGEMRRTVDLVRDGQLAEAYAIVQTDAGKAAMDRIRTIINNVIERADGRLVDQVGATVSSSSWLKWTTILGSFTIIVVLGGAMAVIFRYVSELQTSRQEIETLNTGLERKVQERTEELIRANQEVQRFAYIVTHDLRAPLVNIMGFTSELEACLRSIQSYVLADGQQPSEETVREARLAAAEDLPEAIGFIRTSTKKMDSLINAILKISRDGKRELKIERISLQDVVGMAAGAVQHQVSEAEGRIDISASLPSIVSDRLSLEQVFGNLFDNAIKYRARHRPPEIAVTWRNLGLEGIVIEFADNGRGIAPGDHERIFELFRRSGEQNQPGEGIGLAHVRSLIRNLGGDIDVSSEIDIGTTFYIRLPRDLSKVVRSIES